MPTFNPRFRAGQIRQMDLGGAYRQGREARQRYEFNKARNETAQIELRKAQRREQGVAARRSVQDEAGLKAWAKQYPDLAHDEWTRENAKRKAQRSAANDRLVALQTQLTLKKQLYGGVRTQADLDRVNATLGEDAGVQPLTDLEDVRAFSDEAPALAELVDVATESSRAAQAAPDDERLARQAALDQSAVDLHLRQMQYEAEKQRLKLEFEEAKIAEKRSKADKNRRDKTPKPAPRAKSGDVAAVRAILANDSRFEDLGEADMNDLTERAASRAVGIYNDAARAGDPISFDEAIDKAISTLEGGVTTKKRWWWADETEFNADADPVGLFSSGDGT